MEKKSLIEELLYEEEGTTLDFKQEQYLFNSTTEYQKSEIIKDILAFSNAWRRGDAYILLGVMEIKGGRSKPLGIQDELDDAQLQQFVNSKTQRPIDFTYSTILIDKVKIGIIRIPIQARPYYLEKDYGKLKKHAVYIRRGSSTDKATPDEVYNMGKSEIIEVQEIPNLSFEFANLDTRINTGIKKNIEVTLLDIPQVKDIPDYKQEYSDTYMSMSIPNYYRDLVQYYYMDYKSEKLAFALKNSSNITILDIKVEIIIEKQEKKFTFFKNSDFPRYPQSNSSPIFEQLSEKVNKSNESYIKINDFDDNYRIEVPFKKVQPKQTVFCCETIYIAANTMFELNAKVIIYADNIPEPIENSINITCNVIKELGSLKCIKKIHFKNMRKKLLK